MPEVVCIDCRAEGITSARPIASGTRKPRCATHARAFRRAAKERAHGAYVHRTYRTKHEDYLRLLAAQDGRCAICLRKAGRGKHLAVDHDHACCPGPLTCGECTRGLLCQQCNTDLLGRYDVPALVRAVQYLLAPPARGRCVTPPLPSASSTRHAPPTAHPNG